jgi:NAD(P)-dependent dehydrogenase (short-subunit alcohol dehydrogenase family)
VILDEGGYCLRDVPPELLERMRFTGLEQTTSGLRLAAASYRFPVVEVATSAAKRLIEPPIVSAAVLSRLRTILKTTVPLRIGVIGLGSIGSAVALDFARRGHTVFVYDRRIRDARFEVPETVACHTLDDVFDNASYILGCTGEDIGTGSWLNRVAGSKVLISCSSGDVEFRSLLLRAEERRDKTVRLEPFRDISMKHGRLDLTILRGGFPVNFDGAPDSAPPEDIELTRSLLVGAALQAAWPRPGSTACSRFGEMLDVALQRFVVTRWLDARSRRIQDDIYASSRDHFSDLDFIRRHSSGTERAIPDFARMFMEL